MEKLKTALTFDDVLLQPRYAGFSRADISLKTSITKNIALDIPLVSSPMDTVTKSRLAIALAKLGGLGFIHRNLTIDEQALEVARVKQQGLQVGAAVGSSPGYEARVAKLVASGVDVLLVDSAHGHSKQVISATKYIKKHFNVDVISGNVATREGAKAIIEAGADGLRVGMGPGAICSTRIISGMGVPQLASIVETSAVARSHNIPIVADGGINYSGDITKALAAGASCVMLGRLLAATRESAGKTTELDKDHVPSRFQSIINGAKTYRFKQYRGMGSVAAMKQGIKVSSEDEYHGKSYRDAVMVAEGVEGMVPESGSVADFVAQTTGGIQSGLYYCGANNIKKLWQTAKFLRITQASLSESHPHNLLITNSGANYQ